MISRTQQTLTESIFVIDLKESQTTLEEHAASQQRSFDAEMGIHLVGELVHVMRAIRLAGIPNVCVHLRQAHPVRLVCYALQINVYGTQRNRLSVAFLLPEVL